VLAGARGEHSTVAGRRAALLAAADRLDAVADAVDAAAKAEADLGTASRRLDDLLAGAGLADAATARANALDPAALVALADRVEADEQHRTAVRGRLEADEFAGLDGAGERAARSAVAEAEAVARAAADAEEAALAAHALAAERVRAFAGACGHVATTRTGADDVIASTTPVLRLDALARGTAGDPRMSLVVFVLRYWFDHVVEAANLRLTTMSAGRYQLERTDETETRAKRAGLGLQVVDTHTGASRPTASLSGGETFFASLSLALGLADVVRAQAGGGDLDTLFIDEGFGTLDADTLEQVMDVVDALREGGRVVGIVSHVDDLKARIPERLEVRRHDDGSSWLAVRA
jgi:exonuclease SbcC